MNFQVIPITIEHDVEINNIIVDDVFVSYCAVVHVVSFFLVYAAHNIMYVCKYLYEKIF